MNPFCGRFAECNWISVDHFSGENLKSSVFFLSHCHRDHMHGLHSDSFCELLISKCAKFYCHELSKLLLSSEFQYGKLLEYIDTKEYNETFTVTAICDDDQQGKMLPAFSASVTFLDAQHIPGSVMILFEFNNGFKLLYTADYRLSKDDWITNEALKDPLSTSGYKRLDAFYFDSTFCRRGTENIPTLKQSRELCVQVVKKWLEKNPSNKVLIWCGRYGHEFFLKGIWDELNIKCHVTMAKYRLYSKIDSLADCVTPIARDTRVHACAANPHWTEEAFHENNQNMVLKRRDEISFKQKISACWQCRPDSKTVLVIKPSAIWFARRNKTNVLGYENDRFVRILYSGHSSLTEVESALSLLRPVRVHPNTVDKRSKNFGDKLINYFSPYCSDGSSSKRSLSLTGGTIADEITILDVPEKSLKPKVICEITIEDDDCEVTDHGLLKNRR